MENYFMSPLALAALVPVIAELLKEHLRLKDQVLFTVFKKKIYFAQLIAIGVGITLTLVGMWLNLGFLAGMSVVLTLVWGLFIGLAGIGMFGVGYLEILYLIINKSKTSKNESN
jgi:hypothetical protein